jgi:hypothetical protein
MTSVPGIKEFLHHQGRAWTAAETSLAVLFSALLYVYVN